MISDTKEGFPLPVNVIESDLLNALRFVSNNLDSFSIDAQNVHVVCQAGINEVLFDLFFILKDLSVVQIPFENFFVHHQSFSNELVMADHPPQVWNALEEATGCDSFECIKAANVEDLLKVDQTLFKFTNEWHQQINRLFPFRQKYKFTFLLDQYCFNYPKFGVTFDEFIDDILIQNRRHPSKVAILLDYYYQKKQPRARKDIQRVMEEAYYDFMVRSPVASTINATFSSRIFERNIDDKCEEPTDLFDIITIISSTLDVPYTTKDVGFEVIYKQ